MRPDLWGKSRVLSANASPWVDLGKRFIAYPLGIQGIVVGEGDTYEAALANVKSAIEFHVETFGAGNFRLIAK